VIEALLMVIFVSAIVLLMFAVSRKIPVGQEKNLGLFSYPKDSTVDDSDSTKKPTRYA